ncbi:hypothetical protein T265_09737 [Opisthorchis viverrini]|uniref:Uncharacterized protein n=1 Tax=Opisthorchis viverrini TaxID=6198 RepID=A0A074ZFS2_OPIVI|nr:hypothetical protein T265_09737 [Opisthorchis viverrini]KER22085.1 hypothetical protein T265_09737 [Opisthorchis viverrini]
MILFQIDAKSLPNGEPEHNELHAFQILDVPAQLVVEAINKARESEKKFPNIPVLICPEVEENYSSKPSSSGSIGDSYSRNTRKISLQGSTDSSNKIITATRPDEVAGQFDFKRFITNRGDIISALLRSVVVRSGGLVVMHNP